jgi:hypothetical protein
MTNDKTRTLEQLILDLRKSIMKEPETSPSGDAVSDAAGVADPIEHSAWAVDEDPGLY